MIREYIVADYPLMIALLVVAVLTTGSMAVRSVSRIWLRHWTERRLRGSEAVVTYLERPHRLLIAAGFGTALTLVLAGVLLGLRSRGAALFVNVAIMAGLVVLIGQVIPRAIGRQWPTQLVPVLVPVLRFVELIVSPIVSLGRYIAVPFERRRGKGAVDLERESIQELLREAELEGVGQREESAIITGVVEFAEKRVRDVMTPREEIFALEDSLDPRTLAVRLAQSEYSRVPIYRETLDNVTGMVHAFDVLKAGGERMPPLRPTGFAAPATPCNELLFRMLRERLHLAIVQDLGGRTIGLLTLEDLLEELVGDIRDEHDEPDTPRTAPSRGSA